MWTASLAAMHHLPLHAFARSVRLLGLLLALGWPLLAGSASAQDWAATFTPADVSARFPGGTRFLVVAPGGPSAEAGTALVDALRQAAFPLIMTAESLGDVAALDDQAILGRAAALPVDAILIVRVFPGATPETPNVVVVAYDRAAHARGSLQAVAGGALASEKPAPAAPVTVALAAPQAARAPTSAAQREYERQLIWFGYRHVVDVGEGAAQYGRRPVRGLQRERLGWADFYEAIERPDLARKFTRNWRLKKLFIIGAVGGLAGAGALVFATAECTDAHTDFLNPDNDGPLVIAPCRNLAVGAAVLGGAGFGMLLTAIILHKQPVSREEARLLAEEHNARLRKKYGLPDHMTKTHVSMAARQRELSLSVTPVLLSGGGQLGTSLRF
jgi:hypothetical protein